MRGIPRVAISDSARARASLDRHATYIVAAYLAGAARQTNHRRADDPARRTKPDPSF
jgi:hypothetical protein